MDVAATGYAVEEAPEYPELQRSMLIANATKHGDGTSMDKLLQAAPELFVGGTDSEHLRVGVADFDRAVAAVDAFWPAYEDGFDRWFNLQQGAPSLKDSGPISTSDAGPSG